MAKNEVATTQEAKLPTGYDYGSDAHDGYGDMGLQDLSIPFLNLLQSNSPEVEEPTIPGVAAGLIMNSVTRELVKMPVVFMPLYREEIWVEWKPRNQGGGLLGRYLPQDSLVQDIIKRNGGSRIPPQGDDKKRIPFKTPNGGELVETYYVYGFLLDETGQSIDSYAVISFSSTKIKVQKDWMSSMYMVKGKPPLYANRAKISTARERREGGTFFNFVISPFADTWTESLIPPNQDWGRVLLSEAKTFIEMIQSGKARAADAGEERAVDDAPVGGGGRGADEDAPF